MCEYIITNAMWETMGCFDRSINDSPFKEKTMVCFNGATTGSPYPFKEIVLTELVHSSALP
jgi:hypothetical protein